MAKTTQSGPYQVEAQDEVRDLWMIRSADGLVIGPIFGRGTADLLAAAPTMLAACKRSLELIEACGFGGSNARAEKRMEKYLADVIRSAEGGRV
jgi:hypothetical protein